MRLLAALKTQRLTNVVANHPFLDCSRLARSLSDCLLIPLCLSLSFAALFFTSQWRIKAFPRRANKSRQTRARNIQAGESICWPKASQWQTHTLRVTIKLLKKKKIKNKYFNNSEITRFFYFVCTSNKRLLPSGRSSVLCMSDWIGDARKC